MRTFIFIKAEDNKIIIKGMEQSNLFPSDSTQKGGAFEGCECIEVREHCHIELVIKGI